MYTPFESLLHEVGPGPSEATEVLLGDADPDAAVPATTAHFDFKTLLSSRKVSSSLASDGL